MKKRTTGRADSPLDAESEQTMSQMLGEVRELLLARARKTSPGSLIGVDDLELAYKDLLNRQGGPDSFDAQAIISLSLRENRVFEGLAYAMAVLLFVMGAGLVAAGVFAGSDASYRVSSIVGGSLFQVLLLIPFRFAIQSRKHNIALRMLGILLDRNDDPRKLAEILKNTFFAVVVGRIPEGGKPW